MHVIFFCRMVVEILIFILKHIQTDKQKIFTFDLCSCCKICLSVLTQRTVPQSKSRELRDILYSLFPNDWKNEWLFQIRPLTLSVFLSCGPSPIDCEACSLHKLRKDWNIIYIVRKTKWTVAFIINILQFHFEKCWETLNCDSALS